MPNYALVGANYSEALVVGTSSALVVSDYVETLINGVSNALVASNYIEVMHSSANAQVEVVYSEALINTIPDARIATVYTEALISSPRLQAETVYGEILAAGTPNVQAEGVYGEVLAGATQLYRLRLSMQKCLLVCRNSQVAVAGVLLVSSVRYDRGMTKKHIITIAGRLGSGKSSTAKTVAEALEYEHFSSGDLFRAIAAEQSQSVLDANVAAEKDSSIDYLVDQRLRDIGEHEDFKVVDSRTAWHWMPKSFKVYLNLPTDIAAKRIIDKAEERKTANEDIPSSVEEYAKQLDVRYHSENKRYKNLYDIDPSDMSNYDLVLDTSKQNLSGVVDAIVSEYKKWLES